MEKPLGLDRISVKNATAWRKAFEAKINGVEIEETKARNSAWLWDLIIGIGGAIIIWKIL
jgi:hypothetical protein